MLQRWMQSDPSSATPYVQSSNLTDDQKTRLLNMAH
jgi:hypothetical protein